jgi:peroxiredoxin
MLELIKEENAQPAPGFDLLDSAEKPVRLSDYRGKSNVVLVLNRGFF